jgi:hypothetical protein
MNEVSSIGWYLDQVTNVAFDELKGRDAPEVRKALDEQFRRPAIDRDSRPKAVVLVEKGE